MKNKNFIDFESWCVDLIILDEEKNNMQQEVTDIIELMEDTLFWNLFPSLKNKYDFVFQTFITAFDYVYDYVLNKNKIDWESKEIESLEQLYTWLKTKSWQIS